MPHQPALSLESYHLSPTLEVTKVPYYLLSFSDSIYLQSLILIQLFLQEKPINVELPSSVVQPDSSCFHVALSSIKWTIHVTASSPSFQQKTDVGYGEKVID